MPANTGRWPVMPAARVRPPLTLPSRRVAALLASSQRFLMESLRGKIYLLELKHFAWISAHYSELCQPIVSLPTLSQFYKKNHFCICCTGSTRGCSHWSIDPAQFSFLPFSSPFCFFNFLTYFIRQSIYWLISHSYLVSGGPKSSHGAGWDSFV